MDADLKDQLVADVSAHVSQHSPSRSTMKALIKFLDSYVEYEIPREILNTGAGKDEVRARYYGAKKILDIFREIVE